MVSLKNFILNFLIKVLTRAIMKAKEKEGIEAARIDG